MIDSNHRSLFQKRFVDPVVKIAPLYNCSPFTITLLGLISGLCIPFFLFFKASILSFCFLLFSGYCDILDGSIARRDEKVSDVGALFDILSDRVVESAVLLGLFLYSPETRALYTILMMGASYLCVTSFLVVGIFTKNSTQKSFYYSPGLIERSEAFIMYAVMILLPFSFFYVALLYTFLVTYTAVKRAWDFTRAY
jgi:archaetidylinositol phosphate synthase